MEVEKFPPEEKYGLTGQIRRSSRSVCANIAEAWGKRRYKAAFMSKLNDAETEAVETQVLLEFSFKCKYINHFPLAIIYDYEIVSYYLPMFNYIHLIFYPI